MEIILFGVCVALTVLFLIKWYRPIAKAWPKARARTAKVLLSLLPIVVCAGLLLTLTVFADQYVKTHAFYILFYLFMGFAWLLANAGLMRACFDLSSRDDALYADNKATILPSLYGLLGLSVIYAGSNVGDGPGFYCVVFAYALGAVVWFILAFILNKTAGVFERVTVERDTGCGIRLGCYFLAAGIILARACSGDWTSFGRTVVEMADGWLIAPLFILALVVEKVYAVRAKNEYAVPDEKSSTPSVLWGAVYIVAAVASIFIPSIMG